MKAFLIVLLAVVGVAFGNNESVAPNTSDAAPDKTLPAPDQTLPAPDKPLPGPDQIPKDPNVPSNPSSGKSELTFGSVPVKGCIDKAKNLVQFGADKLSKVTRFAINKVKDASKTATDRGKETIASSTGIADSVIHAINDTAQTIPIIGLLVGFGTNLAQKSVHSAAGLGTTGLDLFNTFEDTKLSWMDRITEKGNNYVNNFAEEGAKYGKDTVDSGVKNMNKVVDTLFGWF